MYQSTEGSRGFLERATSESQRQKRTKIGKLVKYEYGKGTEVLISLFGGMWAIKRTNIRRTSVR